MHLKLLDHLFRQLRVYVINGFYVVLIAIAEFQALDVNFAKRMLAAIGFKNLRWFGICQKKLTHLFQVITLINYGTYKERENDDDEFKNTGDIAKDLDRAVDLSLVCDDRIVEVVCLAVQWGPQYSLIVIAPGVVKLCSPACGYLIDNHVLINSFIIEIPKIILQRDVIILPEVDFWKVKIIIQ